MHDGQWIWAMVYKINSKANFLVSMATILMNNWNIYSWHHLISTFVWLSIVSCQSLNHFTLFPNPFSTWCNTNFGCKTTFSFMRHMLQILHANILMCEVACSQSVTSPSLHSFVISCIVVTNCTRALSIMVDEFIVSINITMAPIGRSLCSTIVSPLNSMIPSSFSRCSFSSSSLDSISSKICYESTNMWPNPPWCDPYHVP